MSLIDPTLPVYGTPSTQSVRDNFAHAATEIDGLTANKADKTALASYLPIAGGVLTGTLTLAADPVGTKEAATRAYVDSKAGAYLPLVGGTMLGPMALSADPSQPMHPVSLRYMQSQTVLLQGGQTMTGLLILSGDPTDVKGAATKQYVDSKVTGAGYLPLGGGIMTGPIALAGNPTQANHAVNMGWSDTAYLKIGGGTLTGPLTLAGPPTLANHAATMAWTSQQIGSVAGIVEAPAGGPYGRGSSTWTPVLAIAGGTLTGPLTLNADPVNTMHAATMGWTVGQVGKMVPIAGGTMTGPLRIAPTAAVGTQLDLTATVEDVVLRLNGVSGKARYIWGGTSGVSRWLMLFGDGVAESGVANGSNCSLAAYDNNGNYLYSPLAFIRSTGVATFSNNVVSLGNILSQKAGGNAFLGSYHTGASSCLGMWNYSNVLYFGNADGNGVPSGPSRMYIDGNSNLQLSGGGFANTVFQADRIYAWRNATSGGAVISGAAAWSSGFRCENNGTITWGNSDGVGITNTRMSLDASGNLYAIGGVFASGNGNFGLSFGNPNYYIQLGMPNYYIYTSAQTGGFAIVTNAATNLTLDVSGNLYTRGNITCKKGVYYTDLVGDHCIGFYWGGAKMNMYADGNFAGTVNTTPFADAPEYAEIVDRLDAMTARLETLEGTAA